MTSLGIWSCQWRELRPINFGSNPNTAQNNTNTVTDSTGMERDISAGMEGEDDGTKDIEQGYGRGRGRGRGRDGAGDYEMVGMGTKADENNNTG